MAESIIEKSLAKEVDTLNAKFDSMNIRHIAGSGSKLTITGTNTYGPVLLFGAFASRDAAIIASPGTSSVIVLHSSSGIAFTKTQTTGTTPYVITANSSGGWDIIAVGAFSSISIS